MTIFDFMNNNWWLTLFLALIAASIVKTPFHCAFRAYNRHLRSKNIAAHGWPTPPVDADGDIVYPDKEDEE